MVASGTVKLRRIAQRLDGNAETGSGHWGARIYMLVESIISGDRAWCCLYTHWECRLEGLGWDTVFSFGKLSFEDEVLNVEDQEPQSVKFMGRFVILISSWTPDQALPLKSNPLTWSPRGGYIPYATRSSYTLEWCCYKEARVQVRGDDHWNTAECEMKAIQ